MPVRKLVKWLPWRYVVKRVARAQGFIDPISVLGTLHRFAQPSEIQEPLELLRAGVVFHARGLINTRAIQHNLDWVWPFWVERQFDPLDDAFIPRAFSVTHVNLTHRNWTAVGKPNLDVYPIVDPRGLVTPAWDSWSIDAWIVSPPSTELIPSRAKEAAQELELTPELCVVTNVATRSGMLENRVRLVMENGQPQCEIAYRAKSATDALFVISVRPYNPEGVSFINDLRVDAVRNTIFVDGEDSVTFSQRPDRYMLSDYRGGDVYHFLKQDCMQSAIAGGTVHCSVGMATGAAVFALEAGKEQTITAFVSAAAAEGAAKPLFHSTAPAVPTTWERELAQAPTLSIPEKRWQFLYDAAVKTIVLHAPHDIYPGPYTYRRFWFRDAAFIANALLGAGCFERVKRTLDTFPSRQSRNGYFLSQEGEWDSNGQALWILHRYCALSGQAPDPKWRAAIESGARWITKKRIDQGTDLPHAGLLPAGFSAEHLGLNDFYYWDDFWGVGGLRAASSLLQMYGDSQLAAQFKDEAGQLLRAIEKSLQGVVAKSGSQAMPASPYRRMDAGAIGSLAAGYPLQILSPQDPALLGTMDFLQGHCLVHGAFFQDMIHSGLNAYLTVHMAQVLLRAGDPGYLRLLQSVAELATPTGQWPEAIHPRTRGGCMGDGQHAWAAAEWVLAIHAMFVREEKGELILCSGIPAAWVQDDGALQLGPVPTSYGPIHITIECRAGNVIVRWEGEWRGAAPEVTVKLPFATQRPVADWNSSTNASENVTLGNRHEVSFSLPIAELTTSA